MSSFETTVYWIGAAMMFFAGFRLAFFEKPKPKVSAVYLMMFVVGGGCSCYHRNVAPAVNIAEAVSWIWFVGCLVFGLGVAYRDRKDPNGKTLFLFFGSIFAAIIGVSAIATIVGVAF